jgi:hypothetical protein
MHCVGCSRPEMIFGRDRTARDLAARLPLTFTGTSCLPCSASFVTSALNEPFFGVTLSLPTMKECTTSERGINLVPEY